MARGRSVSGFLPDLRAPQPLTAAHLLDGFDSGEASLDDWLKRRALANQQSVVGEDNLARADTTEVLDFQLANLHQFASVSVSRM